MLSVYRHQHDHTPAYYTLSLILTLYYFSHTIKCRATKKKRIRSARNVPHCHNDTWKSGLSEHFLNTIWVAAANTLAGYTLHHKSLCGWQAFKVPFFKEVHTSKEPCEIFFVLWLSAMNYAKLYNPHNTPQCVCAKVNLRTRSSFCKGL